jgi:glycosyltransferase involved in cell wall biosynthesis
MSDRRGGVQGPVRVGLFAASPVYYQAPLYRRLAADPRVEFTALFASSSGVRPGDRGYGSPVAFDADALTGFRSNFLRRAELQEPTGSFLSLRDVDVVGAIARGNYDVLWLHGYYSLTHLLAAATQVARRRPIMFREEQTLLHRRAFWKRILKEPLLRALFSRSIGLAIGTANRSWLTRYGIDERRIFLVPYCVDNEALRQAAARLRPQRESLRRELGIPPDAGPVVLTVARLVPKKQPLFLLEAFRRVHARRPCALLYVGAGELEGELREAIRRERAPDVVIAGFLNQSEIAKAYVAADVFALPSRYDETWGLAVNEAMNFALPVVVSEKVGCAADLVRDGENGFVVRADDSGELAERLARLVDSPGLRARLGASSLERVSAWNYEIAADGALRAIAHAVGPERWAAAGGLRNRVPAASAAEVAR